MKKSFRERCTHRKTRATIVFHFLSLCLSLPSPRARDCRAAGSCSDGIPGASTAGDSVCCVSTCSDEKGQPACGGRGCRDREGGPDGCCIGRISEEGTDCETSGTAPCYIGERFGLAEVKRAMLA